jgi:hypothetical protein
VIYKDDVPRAMCGVYDYVPENGHVFKGEKTE